MEILGKPLKEFLGASKWFLIIVFLGTVFSVVWRLSTDRVVKIPNYLGIVTVIIIVLAGWKLARKDGFNLLQTGFAGFLLFLTTVWSTPFFHKGLEVIYLILINAVIFCAGAIFGWVLSEMITRIRRIND